jgi:hypothetical protein
MLIAPRDLCRSQQALPTLAHTAFAAHYLALGPILKGLPSGAATDGAYLGRSTQIQPLLRNSVLTLLPSGRGRKVENRLAASTGVMMGNLCMTSVSNVVHTHT